MAWQTKCKRKRQLERKPYGIASRRYQEVFEKKKLAKRRAEEEKEARKRKRIEAKEKKDYSETKTIHENWSSFFLLQLP